jgi:hypothetical protein
MYVRISEGPRTKQMRFFSNLLTVMTDQTECMSRLPKKGAYPAAVRIVAAVTLNHTPSRPNQQGAARGVITGRKGKVIRMGSRREENPLLGEIRD